MGNKFLSPIQFKISALKDCLKVTQEEHIFVPHLFRYFNSVRFPESHSTGTNSCPPFNSKFQLWKTAWKSLKKNTLLSHIQFQISALNSFLKVTSDEQLSLPHLLQSSGFITFPQSHSWPKRLTVGFSMCSVSRITSRRCSYSVFRDTEGHVHTWQLKSLLWTWQNNTISTTCKRANMLSRWEGNKFVVVE
jgi:hypothetical protein